MNKTRRFGETAREGIRRLFHEAVSSGLALQHLKLESLTPGRGRGNAFFWDVLFNDAAGGLWSVHVVLPAGADPYSASAAALLSGAVAARVLETVDAHPKTR